MATLQIFLATYLWAFQFVLGFYIALYVMFGQVRQLSHKIILFVLIKVFVSLNFLIARLISGLNWLYQINAYKPQETPLKVKQVKSTIPQPVKPATVKPTAKEVAETETPTLKNPNVVEGTEKDLALWTRNPDVKVHEN